MKFLIFSFAINFLSVQSYAVICEQYNDGEASAKKPLYSIRIETQNNGLWDYISNDPSAWIIVATPNKDEHPPKKIFELSANGNGSISFSENLTDAVVSSGEGRFTIKPEMQNKFLS